MSVIYASPKNRAFLAFLKHRRAWFADAGGYSVQRITQDEEDRITEDGELRVTEGT